MIAGVIFPLSANAVALKVCQSGCPYSDVQAAIDAASSGDTIRIGNGVYGAISIVDKSLRIIGAGNAATKLQEGNPVIRVICDSVNPSQVTISQVTVTNEYDSGDGLGLIKHTGRGLINSGCEVMLKDTVISGHRCRGGCSDGYSSSGAGLFNDMGYLTVKSSVISNNNAYRGAGIINYQNAIITLIDSQIMENISGIAGTKSAGYGGGIVNFGEAVIRNSVFLNNATDGRGRAILNFGSVRMVNVTVHANSASQGGGMANDSASDLSLAAVAKVNDSKFINNEATAAAAWNRGGGIYNCGQLTLRDTVLKKNKAEASYRDASAIGGGVYTGCGETVINGSKIILNSVNSTGGGTFSGGGLYTEPGAVIEVKDSIIRDNSPDGCVGGGC